MTNNNLLLGIFYGLIGQTLTFLQLQGDLKYNWYSKYPLILLFSSVPISWFYIQSVRCLIYAFNKEIWPSRLIGFAVGIVVFTILSHLLFKEPITLKVILCLFFAFCIIFVQIFMK